MGSPSNTDTSSTFHLLAREGAARRGRLHTLHGVVETPVFMPVGTQGSVKALTSQQVADTGAQIILGNTYHLSLRPGAQIIRQLGGLHNFIAWRRPILTDSGGFQVFSLAKLRRVDDAGITFQSHIDGSKIRLSPRECFEIQRDLGSDIAMVLDECPPWPCSETECAAAVRRTLRWAQEFIELARDTGFLASGHLVFGISQGSAYEGLRRECAQALTAMDFPGYAIGGVSVGEPEPEMLAQVATAISCLPLHKPRYVMGVGTPPQLLKMIALGVDMFDCVMPTRLARHGTAFTPDGTINLRNERFKLDERPLVEGADNYCCRHFSRAYLRHLFIAGEMTGATLLAIHNTHFFQHLMALARSHIEAGSFTTWASEWIARYEANNKKTTPPS